MYIHFLCLVGFVSSCWLQYSLCTCVCVCIKCVGCFTSCPYVVVVVHVMLLIFMFCPFFLLLLLLLLLITYVHWCFLCLLTMGGDDLGDKVQQLMMSCIRHGCQLCLTCSWKSLSPAPLYPFTNYKLNKALKISWAQTVRKPFPLLLFFPSKLLHCGRWVNLT